MDVSAMASTLSQAKLAQAVSVSVAKIAMDTVEQSMNNQLKALEQSVTPHKGGNIDIRL